eukprot:6121011-Lingulodinium_polyedra.AAC.1
MRPAAMRSCLATVSNAGVERNPACTRNPRLPRRAQGSRAEAESAADNAPRVQTRLPNGARRNRA